MKELYTSPELKVVCFAPVERLASTIKFSDLLNITLASEGEAVVPSGGDIDVPIPKISL